MATHNQQDRNDYDISTSETAQSNFETVAGQVESLLSRRDQDVKAAMADYQADGVSDEYAALEKKWNDAGQQVREVIRAIRTSLEENDDVARRTMQSARNAIPG
ncbi:hypothetical protein DEO23_12115 [Brachybacterium endophyticum]|uniref:Pore-forming ESAT-6 family protein n=1 Tax=Brachybacterium endophyticum TaxID=2182385 RepID=A0A2U2RHK8_9MICO|nr:pore-forming ESAT-6 family protein [Brachybacterium endophyticum]PWH05334.1 hypothetical protein DEO23_12115 [Brachybacterium endophyticum]